MTIVPIASDSSGAILGSTEPRIWTPPLRELTEETTDGFAVIRFAKDKLGTPLDPWQEFAVIHGLELLPGGLPRFHTILLIAARQNGKTFLPKVLTLYWMFEAKVPLIVGSSTKLTNAKKTWMQTVAMAEQCPALRSQLGRRWKREANGQESFWTPDGAAYEISAANDDCARGLTVDRLLMDELRMHHTYGAWGSAEPATSSAHSQIWATTNAGDDRSIVLNDLREQAITFIETGQGDDGLGILEWSSPEHADPLDVQALAQANPSLGRRLPLRRLLGRARNAVDKGGDALIQFKTNYMCIRVPKLNPAIDPASWRECRDAGDLSAVRSRVALCLDVSPSLNHATLCAAAVLPDGRTRVEVVESWTGPGCTDQVRNALPDILARVKPQTLGWLPAGPAAALAADLAVRKGRTKWPPPGITVAEIRGETSAACMGLTELVASKQIAHNDDPLLNAHIGEAERLMRGDAWVFSRKGNGNVDAAYAAAGAVFLARTLPPPVGKPRIIVSE